MKPTPLFVGDAQGSTLSIMLFPDDLAKARNWHAKYLARGPLDAYRAAGHKFDDQWPSFLQALREADVSNHEAEARVRGGGLAAEATKVLWAMICDGNKNAGWKRAIDMVCDHSNIGNAGSPNHIRTQLKIFAPVLHLWLAWRLSEVPYPPAADLFMDGYAMLFGLREWEASRPKAFRRADGYLSADEYGPWPELARLMELLGGHRQRRLSLRQGIQTEL